MAEATASTNIPLDWIQLYPLMATDGLTLEAIASALTEPVQRSNIVKSWLQSMPNEIDLPAELDREACVRLVAWTHDLWPARYWPEWDDAAEIEAENQIKEAEAERLATDKYVRELLKVLTPRQRSVLILDWGLDGQGRRKQKDIAAHFNRSGTAISNTSRQAVRVIRAEVLRRKHQAAKEAAKAGGSNILEQFIEILNLDERPLGCLRRARIRTVGELILKEEDDLLAITNFGMKSLDNVTQRLAEFGLTLADPAAPRDLAYEHFGVN